MCVYSYINTHVSYIHVYAIVRLFVGFDKRVNGRDGG